MVEQFQSWAAMSADMEISFEALASDDEHIATRFTAHGHSSSDLGGGVWELALVLAASLCDGRIAQVELFDGDGDAAAVDRYAELRQTSIDARGTPSVRKPPSGDGQM